MKLRLLSTTRLSFPLAAAIAALLAAPSASAANLYWDTNGTTADSGAATGTWGIDSFWSTDVAGLLATANTTTTGVDDLFFSAGTTGSGGIVTVDGFRTARKLTFEEGAITLSGGTSITLAGGGGLAVDTLADDAIVSTALTANGNNTFNVGTGRTLTMDTGAFTRGISATLNVQGAGTVTSTKTGLTTGGMVNGIIGPWASFGTAASTQYATFSGNNIVGLTGTASTVAAIGNTPTVNYDVAAFGTLVAGASVNTLRYTGAAGTIAGGLTTKGIMNAGSGLLTFSGPVTSGATATELVVNTANADLAFDGIVTGAITKTGSGTMTLGGTPIHALSGWTVNEGVLVLNSALNGTTEVIPSGTINSGGTVKLAVGNRVANGSVFTINAGGIFDTNGQGDQIGRVIGAGSITNTGALTSNLQINPAGGIGTFSGVIGGGAQINFIVNGSSGTQTLTGLNTYTGITQVRQGILSINSIGNVIVGGPGVPSAIGAPTTVANGTIAMGISTTTGTLVYTGEAAQSDRVINLGGTSGGATIDQSAVSGLLKFTSNLTATGVGSKTLTLRGSTTGTGEISGAIVDNSTTGTTVSTAASTASTSLVLGSVVGLTATNPISGTGITGGTTIVGIDTATRTVTLSASATVASGAVITSVGLVNITSVNKTGTGTWTLSGTNTYSGATTISDGTLRLSGTGKLGSGNYAGAISIANGATFDNNSSGTQTLSGAITGAGTLTNSGGGGLILTNAGNSFGALSISNSNSRVFVNNATALPAATTVNIASGALVLGASATRANAVTVASGGTLTARAATTLSNVTLPGSGSVIFNNDDANTQLLTISNDQALTGALTVQVGGTRMLTTGGSIGRVDLSGNIAGEGSLVVTSSGNSNNVNNQTGVLTLSGINTYTGATTVSAGTLFVTGSLTSDVSVSDAATIGGGGAVGAVSFGGGSFFDIALAVGGLDSLASTTISFASAGFGIDNLRYNGVAVDWSTIGDNTYTLISGDLNETNLDDFGSANAFDIGGGRSAYFAEGSLQLVVIPEPSAALLGGLGLLALLRRRRA